VSFSETDFAKILIFCHKKNLIVQFYKLKFSRLNNFIHLLQQILSKTPIFVDFTDILGNNSPQKTSSKPYFCTPKKTVIMKRQQMILTICLMVFMILSTVTHAQKIGLKTNVLYGVGTLTPNLSMEMFLGNQSTLNISGGYNPWNLKGTHENNKKLAHWLGCVEYRRWICESFNGHFFGAHVLGGQYNIGGHDIPLLFDKEFRQEGWTAGAGINYGYHWMWSKRWSLEFNIGFGYAYLEYGQYGCLQCAEKEGRYTKNYFGPTQMGLNLVFMIK